jgi:predicted dithiol-disulfide oxidoreductase (DUF899 family)
MTTRSTPSTTVPERGLRGAGTPAYRERRAALLVAETELREHTERVARQRRDLPPGPLMPAYRLTEGDPPVAVDLPDLFDGHDVLVVHHLMFWPTGGCPMCSMWLDGLNGVAAHLAQHVALVVTAPAPLPQLRDWGRARGWSGLRLVSAAGTDLGTDLGFADTDGGQMPGVSVFTRDGGRARLAWHGQPGLVEGGRGIDALSPVWNVLDLTPGGRPDWWPGNDYPLTWSRPGPG